jgi:hypothetical protein
MAKWQQNRLLTPPGMGIRFSPAAAHYLGVTMWRICLLPIILAAMSGCSSTGDKGSWDEARKDWNGDNMKMHGDMSSFNSTWDRPLQSGGR